MKFGINKYKTLLAEIDAYDNEACRIFNKLLNADVEVGTHVLEYGKFSYIERIDWDYSDEENICITYYDYGYDLYVSNNIYIPIKIFGNERLIEQWINSKIEEALIRQNEVKEKQQLAKEAHEKAEYERLKAKFENE